MKPKKVICPICGEKMVASNWGMKRVLSRVLNYINYECSCGCTTGYIGEKNCWVKDNAKLDPIQGMPDPNLELNLLPRKKKHWWQK